MASVDLKAVWLHDADDHDDYVTFTKGTTSRTLTDPGEVVTYASGRRRRTRRAGKHKTVEFTTLVDEGSAELEWLRDMVGATVMYRDNRGLLFHATYGEVGEPREWAGGPAVRATVRLEEITRGVEV